jgi:hypothetical protein
MGLKGILITIFIFAHLAFIITHLYDLKTKSKRPHKWKWALIISLFPYVGVWLYDRTKQRRRQTQW